MTQPTYSVDPHSAIPPYEQLRRQIIQRITSGELPPGTRLPTVRALAQHAGVAANTVARTYRELDKSGVVHTRGRSGTYVAARDERARRAERAAREFANIAAEIGLPSTEALPLVKSAMEARMNGTY